MTIHLRHAGTPVTILPPGIGSAGTRVPLPGLGGQGSLPPNATSIKPPSGGPTPSPTSGSARVRRVATVSVAVVALVGAASALGVGTRQSSRHRQTRMRISGTAEPRLTSTGAQEHWP